MKGTAPPHPKEGLMMQQWKVRAGALVAVAVALGALASSGAVPLVALAQAQ